LRILIIENRTDLARIWAGFLLRHDIESDIVADEDAAYEALRARSYRAILLDMELPGGQSIRIADFATYRDPEVPIIAVSAESFFSNGTIFDIVPNARGLLHRPPRLEDMAAIIEYYGNRRTGRRQA
jgi:DNA-binding response OmpR family regulator